MSMDAKTEDWCAVSNRPSSAFVSSSNPKIVAQLKFSSNFEFPAKKGTTKERKKKTFKNHF